MRCQQAAEKRSCEIAQTLQVSGQQAPIALVAMGRDNEAKAYKIVIQLPLSVWIDAGVKVILKDVPAPIEARFRNCVPVGCFAEALVKDEVVTAMKAAPSTGTIKFKDALQRDVSLPFSLWGFGPAIDALPKVGSVSLPSAFQLRSRFGGGGCIRRHRSLVRVSTPPGSHPVRLVADGARVAMADNTMRVGTFRLISTQP